MLNHVENRFHAKSSPETLRLGLVFLRLRKRQAKACRHRPTPLMRGAERGVSIRRGHPILCRPTKLCQESSPWSADPRSGQPGCKPFLRLQWAVTPKLTMIAGRQLSIEGAWVRSSFLASTVTRENPPPSIGSLYMVVNRATIFFIEL